MKNETIMVAVQLLNEKRKKELGDRIFNYLRGNKDFIDSKIVLNIDGERAVQVFYDVDVNEGVIRDIHDIIWKFTS